MGDSLNRAVAFLAQESYMAGRMCQTGVNGCWLGEIDCNVQIPNWVKHRVCRDTKSLVGIRVHPFASQSYPIAGDQGFVTYNDTVAFCPLGRA